MRTQLAALWIAGAALMSARISGWGAPVFVNIADSTSGFAQFGAWQINERGEVAFTTADGAGNNDAVYRGSGGPLTTIVDSTGPYSVWSSIVPGINQSGLVSFFANTDVNGLYTGSGGAPAVLYNGHTTSFSTFGAAWLNDSGLAAFAAERHDSSLGIYRGNGGPLTAIDEDTGPRGDFGPNPALNNNGDVAYTANGNTLLMRGNGLVHTTIADSSGDFFYFNDPDISDSGMVAFRALMSPPVGGEGVFIGNGGAVQTIADNTGVFNSFWLPSINDLDEVAFMATLDAGGQGIFTGPDPVADRVVMVGDPLFGSTVTDLMFYPGGFNSHGQLAFGYTLADGRSGVAMATIPEPGAASLLGLGVFLWARRRRPATRL